MSLQHQPGAKVAISSVGHSRQLQFSEATQNATTKREKRKVPSTLERSVPQLSIKREAETSGAADAREGNNNDALARFCRMSAVQQRWLLSFPQELKHLFFKFADAGDSNQMMRQLLRKYPDLGMQTRLHKQTAMALAIQNRRWDAARHILEAWLERKSERPPTCDGQSVEMLLVQSVDHEKAVELLQLMIERNLVQMELKDAQDRNIFHLCALSENKLALRLLSEWATGGNETVAKSCRNALSNQDNRGMRPIELSNEMRPQFLQLMNSLGLATSISADFDAGEPVDSGIHSIPDGDQIEYSQPQKSISDLHLLSEERRQQLSQELINRGKVREFIDCLHRLTGSSTIGNSQQLLTMISDHQLFPIAIGIYSHDSEASRDNLGKVLTKLGLNELLPLLDLPRRH